MITPVYVLGNLWLPIQIELPERSKASLEEGKNIEWRKE